MRQFERDGQVRAAAGDVDAQLSVERRKDVLIWSANKHRSALKIATPSWADHEAIEPFYVEARRLRAETEILHEVDHIVWKQRRLMRGRSAGCIQPVR